MPGAPHAAPELLLYPVFDEAEALAGMSSSEVIHQVARDAPVFSFHGATIHDNIDRL
jgi:hypothetical protein